MPLSVEPSRRILPSLALILLACHPACRPGRAPSAGNLTESREYVDEIGREVRLARYPRRIVSLAPNLTELLYLLGADDRLIGVTEYCNWPEAARKKPRIGGLLNPNYELVLAAHPDLVLATTSGNDQSAVYKLVELDLPVYVTAPRSAENIFETILSVGDVVNRPDRARELVADMKRRLEEVRQRLEGLPATRAFFMTWFDPLLAPGKNTFETDVLALAGVESVTAGIDEFYPRYSLEQILQQDPEVILTVEHNALPAEQLRNIPGWSDLTAVRKGRVYVLSDVIQHPSPRFVDGVEELVRHLHPERFR